MKIEQLHAFFLQSSGVNTDTRKIEKNQIFFALKGANFNANTFAKEALDTGAYKVIIDQKEYYINENTILVDDCLTTLQDLAKYHRNYLGLKIIGLTGSNGKTTTKELIQCVLKQKYITKATIGNLNNHIGVPLTLLSFDKTTEFGIVEMGANHQKEIEFLSSIAQPDFGYITNFGKAHLEGFGGTEGVIKGKSELYTFIKNNNKKVFINLDDPIQKEKSSDLDSIKFGINNKESIVNFSNITANPMVSLEFENTKISSHLIGIYNSNNICAAITIGKYFGIDNESIKNAIENYIPNNNRSQIINKNNNEIILDAYNANPSSMLAALTNFFQLKDSNKIAILGDMFELGNESKKEHLKLIEYCSEFQNVQFYFIGKEFHTVKNENKNFNFFEDFDSFKNKLSLMQLKNNLILIKGSRGMSLERCLDFI